MNKKAIIEVIGELGNQFFIYATAKRIEEKGYSLYFDPAYYSWWPIRKTFARNFILDKYNLYGKIK